MKLTKINFNEKMGVHVDGKGTIYVASTEGGFDIEVTDLGVILHRKDQPSIWVPLVNCVSGIAANDNDKPKAGK